MSLPPTYNLLAKYPNRVYVETGSYRGDSVQLAIDAGFSKIISIDNDIENIKFCKSRFYGHEHLGKMSFIHGDSAECLYDVIKYIESPITFFLDAHSQLFEDEPKMKNPFPLMEEIRQIARHPEKDHVIIIDDMLMMTHPSVTGWSKYEIMEALERINDRFIYQFIANPIRDNILIASL